MGGVSGQNIMILGAGGMLARDVVVSLAAKKANLFLFDIRASEVENLSVSQLDITNASEFSSAVDRVNPNWIINCAAYTAVDLAETEYSKCFEINASALKSMSEVIYSKNLKTQNKAKILHFSTDYLFGGNYLTPIKEEALPYPCGIYGWSKHFGEEFLRTILPEDHLIIRTAWLHGLSGKNFIHTILRLASEKKRLKVVNDQIGSPTFAKWLSEVTVELIEKSIIGTVHATSRGGISWYDFAKYIVEESGLDVELQAQSSLEFVESSKNKIAPRPKYSVLSVEKLESIIKRPSIDWKDGVREHLALLGLLKNDAR
jgi:dTDP-4-dehydrorhamnose reductase